MNITASLATSINQSGVDSKAVFYAVLSDFKSHSKYIEFRSGLICYLAKYHGWDIRSFQIDHIEEMSDLLFEAAFPLESFDGDFLTSGDDYCRFVSIYYGV